MSYALVNIHVLDYWADVICQTMQYPKWILSTSVHSGVQVSEAWRGMNRRGPYENVAKGSDVLRLREMRLQAGYKQDEVSERLGVGQNTVSRWESGHSDPSLNNLIRLASLYECAIGDLFNGGNGLTEEEKELIEWTRDNPREKSVIWSTFESLKAAVRAAKSGH